MKSALKNFILLSFFILATISVSAQKQINQYEPESSLEKGVMLFENKHYAAALEYFENYIAMSDDKNNSDYVMAKYYEAVSALFLGNSKGETKITAFVKENPTSPMAEQANLLYAGTLFNKKKYRNALSVYEDINKSNLSKSEQNEYNFKKAYCYYQTQNISKAAPLFRELIKTESIYRNDARYYYAHILYANGKNEDALKHFNVLKKNKKYSNISNSYILQIHFDNGNFSTVIETGDEILANSKRKQKTDIALMLAESWYRQGDYAKSLEYYNIALSNSNRKFPREVEFKIGFCKMKNNEFKDAINHFTKVTDKNDELSQYSSYYLAQCYTNTDQDKFARNTFYKAYQMNFNDTISENALINYAALSFIPGIDPFNETVDILSEYITKNPNSSNIDEFQEIVINLLLNSNKYHEALETIEQYSNLSQELKNIKTQLTYNVGIQYYNKGQYDNAIDYLRKSINSKGITSKTQSEATFWLADAYYRKDDKNNALKTYQQFINSPMASNTDVYPLAYYNLGYLYLNNGEFNNASIRFKEFINYDNNSDKLRQSDSWLRIGDCYFIQKQYNNAITSYSNAVKINDKNADYAYYQQAMGYGALGKTNEKINCLNIVTERYKKSTFYDKALYEIAMSYLGTNDNRSAITAFERVAKEKPRSSYARKSLMKIGMIYYNNNENEKALERLKNVVAEYPNTDESREALNIISNIYRDMNDIQSYFDYIEKNKLAVISIDKQDSLSFKTIEDFYAKRDYKETLKGAEKYLEKHPNGAYLLKVHYYAMKSMENSNNISEIRPHIEYIINQPDNDYTDQALLLIARMDYDNSDYTSSASHYNRLIDITENQQILTEATEGCMKCYYFNTEYDKAIEKANKLIMMAEISDNQKIQANYILGKSYFDKNDFGEALKYFKYCTDAVNGQGSSENGEMGAECGYYSALCLYELKKYDEAEEKIFEVSDNYNSYLYWTARAFIALSDVYVAKDNTFQAKETLKSVIENYPQDEQHYNEIIEEAERKLNNINID